MSRDQNAGRSHNVKTDNNSFERVEVFRYLETTLTNQNPIQEEIKCRLKLGKACCHSVQNLLSSSLLYKNIRLRYRTIILPVVFYGCEIWPVTMREELRQRVSEKRVLRRIFGPRRDGVLGECSKLHKAELSALYSSPNNPRRRYEGHVACMGRGEV
jgi:hypothetical protein